jgi:large subunit ribosomal protein L25
MATVSLNATSRTQMGKGPARKVRAQGMIPAVVYRAGTAATSIIINPHEVENGFRRSGNRNTLVDIGVDGKNFLCLVKSTQRDPVTDLLLHIDFFQVDDNTPVDVLVPVVPVGKAAGVTLGGRLQLIVRDLKLRCKPADIPENVPVDVTHLEAGEFLKVSSVPAPSNTEIIAPNDFNVFSVIGKRSEEEIEAEEAAAAAAAAGAAEAEASEEATTETDSE